MFFITLEGMLIGKIPGLSVVPGRFIFYFLFFFSIFIFIHLFYFFGISKAHYGPLFVLRSLDDV